jgi:glycosyltransferase involved in cell wall biosynthesis
MIKTAIITERADIGLGGAERSVSELTAELRQQGVETAIVAAKGIPDQHITILCGDYPAKRVPLRAFERALRQHLSTQSYDIVHSTLPMAAADIYQPRGGSYHEAMLRNIASYPFAIQRFVKRGTHLLNFKRTAYLNAEKKICSANNRIVVAALSRYVKKHFQKYYHMPEERIAVIPNGINTDIRPDAAAAKALKERILKSITIPSDKQPVLFLFAANNPRLKGLRELLFAFEDITFDAYVHPILIVVGIKELGPYKSLSEQLVLKNHIISLGCQDSIYNILSICDVAVLPTYYDPCSRFILESLAMGKPVITTCFNGAAERFVNNLHGVVIKEPNYTLLMDALSYFCNPKNIELASQAIIQDNLCEKVSIRLHVTQLIKLYEKILAGKKS